jgi:4-diphosphocytidyl-2-C-methyl-D-erythritol kinase
MSGQTDARKQLIERLQRKVSALGDVAYPVRAPAKVNLRLKVLGRRSDGYHTLSMVNCTTSLVDEVVVRLTKECSVAITVDPPESIDSSVPENLVSKSFVHYLREFLGDEVSFEHLPIGLRCHITKRIPVGAGLGGGSSDAAAVLRILTSLFADAAQETLQITPAQYLIRVLAAALRCGADVPYSYLGGLAWVQGIGEQVSSLSPTRIPQGRVVLAVPHATVSTKDFYSHLRNRWPVVTDSEDPMAARLVGSEPLSMESIIANDFEPFVCELCPEVGRVLEIMRRFFPKTSSVTGSGSASFCVVAPQEQPAASELLEKLRSEGLGAWILDWFGEGR